MISKILSAITGILASIFTTLIPLVRQNFKKIIYSTLAFIAAFLIVTIILFPKTIIAKNYINKYITENKIPITYSDIDIGYFGSSLKNVVYDDKLKISTIKISYNPIGLMMKRLSVDIDSKLGVVKMKFKGDNVEADGKVSLEILMPLLNVDAGGALNMIATYNTTTKKGELKLSSNSITFTHPMMTINADSLNSDIIINGTTVNINQFEAKGANTVTANGKIILNNQNLASSIVDLKGNANFAGLESNFSLTGNLNSIQFKLQ